MAQPLRTLCSRLPTLRTSIVSPASRTVQRRGISIPPGEREKALLEEDPALKHYKSSKETAKLVKRFGDVLVIVVSAGCIYQIYDVTQKRRSERL